MEDNRKFVVHPLSASFGRDRFPAHKRGDKSCPTCASMADLAAENARLQTRVEEAERRSHKGGWVCDCDCHEEIDGLEGADYKAQRQAEDAVGYEEEAARYDAEQAQQEADHRRDVARDEEIVTEEPRPSRPKR